MSVGQMRETEGTDRNALRREHAGPYERFGSMNENNLQVFQPAVLPIVMHGPEGAANCRAA